MLIPYHSKPALGRNTPLIHQTSCLLYLPYWSDKYLLPDLHLFMSWNPASSYVDPSSRQHNLFSGLIDFTRLHTLKKNSLVALMELVVKCLKFCCSIFSQALWLRQDSQLKLAVNSIVTPRISDLLTDEIYTLQSPNTFKLPLFYFLFLIQ